MSDSDIANFTYKLKTFDAKDLEIYNLADGEFIDVVNKLLTLTDEDWTAYSLSLSTPKADGLKPFGSYKGKEFALCDARNYLPDNPVEFDLNSLADVEARKFVDNIYHAKLLFMLSLFWVCAYPLVRDDFHGLYFNYGADFFIHSPDLEDLDRLCIDAILNEGYLDDGKGCRRTNAFSDWRYSGGKHSWCSIGESWQNHLDEYNKLPKIEEE